MILLSHYVSNFEMNEIKVSIILPNKWTDKPMYKLLEDLKVGEINIPAGIFI